MSQKRDSSSPSYHEIKWIIRIGIALVGVLGIMSQTRNSPTREQQEAMATLWNIDGTAFYDSDSFAATVESQFNPPAAMTEAAEAGYEIDGVVIITNGTQRRLIQQEFDYQGIDITIEVEAALRWPVDLPTLVSYCPPGFTDPDPMRWDCDLYMYPDPPNWEAIIAENPDR